MTQLTKNFALSEFVYSDTAKQLEIDNNPTPAHLENLKRTADVLQLIRDTLGRPIKITSGYRSAKLNAAVPGSSKTSAHTKGLAADIRVTGITSMDLAKFIKGMNLPLDQLILEYPNRPNPWVHIGLSDGAPRGMIFTVRDGKPNAQGLVA